MSPDIVRILVGQDRPQLKTTALRDSFPFSSYLISHQH